MIKIASAHLWVHDQEVALKFWTENGRNGSARKMFRCPIWMTPSAG